MAKSAGTITITLLTREQAEAGRPPSPGKRPRRRRKVQTQHEKDRELKTRPKGHARIYNLIIEPWITIKGHQSVTSVVSELRELHARTIHVPKMTHKGMAMAFYSGSWHRIMMLEGKVHIRKLRAGWGLARPGYMPCDCCFFRTDSKELQRVAVGKSNATVQEFHICTQCLEEGVLARTSDAGYIVKRIEDPI